VPLVVLLVMKKLENEWYIVIRALKFTVLSLFAISYIVCPCYPYIESTNSMIGTTLYTG